MRKILLSLLALISATTLAATPAVKPTLPAPKQSVESLNKVIVVVNGQPITQNQFDQFVERSVKRMQMSQEPLPDLKEFKQYLLKRYIDRVLQLQLTKNFNITVSKEQVQKQVQHIMAAEKLTLPQLKQHVHLQGFTYPEFLKEVKTEMLLGQLQQQVTSGQINITKEQVNAELAKLKADKRFAKQYPVIDIVTPLGEGATKVQIARALAVSKDLKSHLVRETSFEKISDKNDHDLGWRTLADLPDVFVRPVSHLQVNGVAGPIRAANGFHLIRLVGVRNSKQALPTLDQIKQQLFMAEMQKHLEKWLKSMRKQADIQHIKAKDA